MSPSVGQWYYGVDPVLAAISDPTPPRSYDVVDHGTGLGAHCKIMQSPVGTEGGDGTRPTSAASSIPLSNTSIAYKALLSKEMRLKAYFQAKYDNLKLKTLFPPSNN